MQQYLDLLTHITNNGERRKNRTGTDTIGVFGYTMRFDLSKGFPAVTTKKLAFAPVVGELLWFIEGSSDERRLAEITYGTRDPARSTIWTANAEATQWKPHAAFEGDLGRVYGVQWRSWRTPLAHPDDANGDVVTYREIDQLARLLDGIKKDPFGRRHILSAWNPGEIQDMALPPCHLLAQFNVTRGKRLDCLMYQRSADVFLGVPFNIASYALLTHMIAHECNLLPGTLTIVLGDAHIYVNHIDQVIEQMSRKPYDLPKLWLNPHVTAVEKFTMDDIALHDYKYHPLIKAPMAV